MASYGFSLSLIDQISAPMRQLQAAVNAGSQTFRSLTGNIHEADRSTASLTQHAEGLRAARNLVEAKDVEQIRAYNLALKETEREIRRLENINGSFLQKTISNLGAINPAIGMAISNPLVMLGGALVYAERQAEEFERGLAKANTTAGLGADELNELGIRLREMGTDAGYADLAKVPEAFDKILGITNDVAKSEDILKVALKGAAAGFTDVNTVGEALSRTMGSIGLNSGISAERVGNVLFAAKRVGAGDLQDFANNIPGLVSSSNELGFAFEEVAGAFAFFTAKGNDASRSTMLMQNLFTLFNKADVISGFTKMGIAVQDASGNTRKLQDIVKDLQEQLRGKGITERANILKQMGLNDAQANQAINVLINDTDKLAETLSATTTPVDELGNAFGNSAHTTRSLHDVMSQVNDLMIKIGSVALPILNGILIGLNASLNFVNDNLTWLLPLIGGVTIAWGFMSMTIGGVTKAGWIYVGLQKVMSMWAGITSAANGLLGISFTSAGAAIISFNGAVYSIPLVGWALAAVAAIGALVLAVAKMYSEWIGFRAMINGVFAVAGELFLVLFNIARLDFSSAAKGLERVFSGKTYQDARNATIARAAESNKKDADKKALSATDFTSSLGDISGRSENDNKATMNGIVNESTAGGTRATQIEIRIDKMVEGVNINVETMKEGAEQLADQLIEPLFNIMNMVSLKTR